MTAAQKRPKLLTIVVSIAISLITGIMAKEGDDLTAELAKSFLRATNLDERNPLLILKIVTVSASLNLILSNHFDFSSAFKDD